MLRNCWGASEPASRLSNCHVAEIRLFHFSRDESIQIFEPRPVEVPSTRARGQEWLNGPLVWAVEDAFQATYLFPRDCPRILVWPTPETSTSDLEQWWGDRTCSMIAHIEWRWLKQVGTEALFRYEFAPNQFEPTSDSWMWVSKTPVVPLRVEVVDDLLWALHRAGVELRIMDELTPLRDMWSTTMHASGIRLRNAVNW
jgi:hypothetical protein